MESGGGHHQPEQSHKKGVTAVICFSPYSGGMEMDAIKLASLLNASVDVVFIAKHNSWLAQAAATQLHQQNITIETIKFVAKFSFAIIFRTRKILQNYQIKNIVFFGASEMRSLFFSCLGLNINFVVRHGTTKSTPKKDFLHRLVYSQVNWHVAICRHLEDNIRYIIPFGKDTRLKVIYSSLRKRVGQILEVSHTQNSTIHLLHVGRVADGKGHIAAINACQILYDNNIAFEFNCVGEIDPNFSDKLQAIVSKKPYKDALKFPGFFADVTKFYNESDIFIFPSKGEGLSNSFIEALGSGLLCMAFNNTSFPELKDLGFEFILVKNGDTEDLKVKLLESVHYLKSHPVPFVENINLANKVFDPNRELNEYLAILQ